MRLVVRAWASLCANTDDVHEKQRCLGAILELEPDLEWHNWRFDRCDTDKRR